MKAYIVVCHYTGCEECGESNAHVVGVALKEDEANDLAKIHEADKTNHLHSFYVEVEPHEVAGTQGLFD